MSTRAFKTRTGVVLGVVCALSLVGLGLLAVFGPELSPTRSGEADVYSMSAVGHGALHDTLEELDIPTAIYRNPKRAALAGKGVLLVLEPHDHLLEGDARRLGLDELIAESHAVFLALPKWRVAVDGKRNPWVRQVAPLSPEEILAPLQSLGIEATLERTWWTDDGPLSRNDYEFEPKLPSPFAQFVRSTELKPLIQDGSSTLLGSFERDGTTVYVLSDPDILQNHGLHRGTNASLVIALLDELREGGPVVFDETLHGFPPRDDSLVRELFRFPLVLVLLHGMLVVGLILWAGMRRFGDAPPPEASIEPGSGFLIRHTAWLLRFGRHEDTAITRYVEDTARDVARRFHFTGQLSSTERDARLDALSASRGTSVTWSRLREGALRAANDSRRRRDATSLQAAHALYQWKQEILDGPRIDSRDAHTTA